MGMANRREHTIWVWLPACCAPGPSLPSKGHKNLSEAVSLQQSPKKCRLGEVSMRNQRLSKSSLSSSIHRRSVFPSPSFSPSCFCCNLRSDFHQDQSKCVLLELKSKWLLLPPSQLCIPLMKASRHPGGFLQLR